MLLRWLLFLFIGLPFQGIVYVIYPIGYAIWYFTVYRETPIKEKPLHFFSVEKSTGSQIYYKGTLLKNGDDHGAFTMYGFLQREGLEALQENGSLLRKRYEDGSMNRWAVSGDVVVAWLFANTLADRPASDNILKLVVDTYIKNLGTLSYDEVAQGYVSVRCNNFGINEAKDSEFLGIAQPAAGPQFYTTSAVLASAYNKGFKYKIMFWSHWVLMGGWYWAFAPVLYSKDNSLSYVRDITMKALYIHLQIFGPRWWITNPMRFIVDKISTHENDLFYAMMGREINPLPESMDAFFSQHQDASSYPNDRMSAFIPDAIRKIQKETKFK